MTTGDGDSSGREWPTFGALAVLTGALSLVAGPIGTVAGLATAVTWHVLGLPSAIAVGHLVLAMAFPTGIDPGAFVVVELAFVVVLLAALVPNRASLRDGVVALGSAVALVGLAWIVTQSQPLWVAAGALLAGFGLAAYTLHRYELVRLGLVPDDHPDNSQPPEP